MSSLRRQIFLMLIVVSFASALISGAVTVLLSADAMTQELQKGEDEVITLAKSLRSEAGMDARAISEMLSSYSMYRLTERDPGTDLNAEQLEALFAGETVSKGWQANVRAYFTMDGRVFAVTAERRNVFSVRETLQGYLNVLCTSVILCTMLCVIGKGVIQPVSELSEATRRIASGDFDARVNHVFRRSNAAYNHMSRLISDFNNMADDLKRIAYLRRDFASNVSHEVKTPIATISGFAQLLESDALSAEERREYSSLIRGECRKLTKLSENMLRITGIESRGQTPRLAEFSLDEQLRRLVAGMMPRMKAKNLSVEVDLRATNILSDAELLEQAWTNLLDNAVKFSNDGGSIGVSISALADSVSVTVSDTGIGISEADQARVFDIFYQADGSRRTEGNGLGLSLCKRVAEALGGEISVKSEPGRGSAFTVTLPQAAKKKSNHALNA